MGVTSLFVAEAAVLGFLTATTFFQLFVRGLKSQGRSRVLWLGASSLLASLGVWATNFSAILAYDPEFRASYDPVWTSASLAAAMAAGFGLAPAVSGRGRWRSSVVGGLYLGVVLTALQVVSVNTRILPGTVVWNVVPLAAAVLVGAGLTTLAIWLALPSRRRSVRYASAALLTAAALGQHFTAMAGFEVQPDPSASIAARGLSPWHMALLVGLVTILLAGAGLIVASFEGRTQAVAKQRVRELADAALDGLVMCDGGAILDANAGFADLVEQDRYQLRGRLFSEFVSAADRELIPTRPGEIRELDLIASDGTRIAAEMVLRELGSGGGRRYVLAVRDVRERRRAEAQIRQLAYHDPLTRLPNRALFHERLTHAMARAERGDAVALLCLDIDHFKAVNDTLGHPVGDKLLNEIGNRLRAAVREVDTVARLGGDEFAILQVGSEQPNGASELARRIIDVVAEPYDLDGHQVVVGTSIGVALAPVDSTDGHQLLKSADLALYRAKSEGRGRCRFFEPEMDARMQARRLLELDLRKALAAGEFELYFQPLMSLKDDCVSSCEALLRWHHPTRGMISPAEFIPLAEEIGLIVPMGEWVLRQACTEAAGWPRDVKVAVNLSPAQFRTRNLVSTVVGALASSGLASSRLELEITESVLLQDNDANIGMLHQLRELGVRISLDDFGTGYSSLSYLRSFPFDKIKIDQSFVRELSTRPDCAAIVLAVTKLGAALGMTTTAEGVETPDQLDRLRAKGCTEAQGYLFSRPKPASEILEQLGSSELCKVA